MDLFQVIMGFEFTKSELEEFYCIFGKLRPQANILHYSTYTQLVRSGKNNKKKKKKPTAIRFTFYPIDYTFCFSALSKVQFAFPFVF